MKLDPWLEPFSDALKQRYSKAQEWIYKIDETEGGLNRFSKGFNKFGFNVDAQNNIHYREWAPNAQQAYLIGDFSQLNTAHQIFHVRADQFPDGWNRDSHPMTKDAYGSFDLKIPAVDGQPAIPHNSKVKVCFACFSSIFHSILT